VIGYAASKAGLIQLTRALARELGAQGVLVNALAPGYVETDLNREFFATEAGRKMIDRFPQRRLGVPEDLDGALLLLAGPAGRFITGAVLVVDGGQSLVV
jgi:NAD(P)-dependent dehydrogenase (short-subunit alcohol dehydrogenase family)